jgi:hypothetical protein
MLRILTEREVWWPVTVAVPGDGGTVATSTGEIHVRYPITREQLESIGKLRGDEVAAKIASFVTGWRGTLFENGDGQAAPFSMESLIAALNIPAVNGAAQLALLEISSGRAAARNFPSGSGGS